MIDIFRFTEIAEASQQILNPLADDKVNLLGDLLRLQPGMRLVDLGCGKGEMLCRYALGHGTVGVGIDIHEPFIAAARARASELGVADLVSFEIGDGAKHAVAAGSYDVGMAIGTSWIGGGLLGTADLLRNWTARPSLLALGEVFWTAEPPPELQAIHGVHDDFVDLVGILDRLTGHGLDLVDMVIASRDDWDRYEAGMWPNVVAWLDANTDDPLAEEVAATWRRNQRAYLLGGRCIGWGVFVVRPAL